MYFAHVNEVRNGYYNPIKEYIFNRPPDCKIRLLSTYCSYFVKGLNLGRSHFISRLSMFVWVNVVLNVDSDWRFNNLCSIHLLSDSEDEYYRLSKRQWLSTLQSYSGLCSPGHLCITFFCFYFVVSFCGLNCKSLHLKQWALTEELYTSKHTFIFLQCNSNIWTSIHIIGTNINESLAKCKSIK